MRLLFVIDSLGSGGAQRQLVSLAQMLVMRGHSVEFFVYYPQYKFFVPTLTQAKIPIHQVPKKNRIGLSILLALRQQLRLGKYDVVLSFLDTPNLYCELARFGKKSPALVVAERSSYPITGPSFAKRFLDQFHRLADCIVTNSYYQADQMVHFSPWMRKKLHVAYNGIDLTVFSPECGEPKKKRTLLAVGSIIPGKNAVGLARALVIYKELYGVPPIINWVGRVYMEQLSQVEYETVNMILRDNDLQEHWAWLGEQEQMNLLYPMYTALIHPSFREGLPNAVCEAMACGLPVLVSNFGEHPHLIDKGANGKLFDPTSPSDIARVMHEFLCFSERKQEQIGHSARQYAERELAIEVSVARYEEIFLSLMGEK